MKKYLVALLLSVLPALAADPAKLEFRLVAQGPSASTTEYELPNPKGTPENLQLEKEVLLDIDSVQLATPAFDQNGWLIRIEFKPDGAKRFAEITEKYINQRIAILVNGKVLSAPIIREKIAGGSALIAGNFTEREAKDLADSLNAK